MVYSRASKFYEPGETVDGTATIKDRTEAFEYEGYTLTAEAYMDTVSQIRGNQGRPPLPEKDRIYFKKLSQYNSKPGRFSQTDPLKFQYELIATDGKELIDAYIGVDFSIVYKVTLSIKPK